MCAELQHTDESKWTPIQTIIGGVISGILRSMDAAVNSLQAHWIQQLDVDFSTPGAKQPASDASAAAAEGDGADAGAADTEDELVVAPGLVVDVDASSAEA